MSGLRAVAVRRARVGDAAAMARIYVEAWRDAYAGLLPDKLLIGMSVERQTLRWKAEIGSGGQTMLVADEAGAVLGLVTAGPARQPARDLGFAAEVYTLYVDPNRQNEGVGRLLLDAALEALGVRGFDSAAVWVLAGNPAAHFYERVGGQRIGAHAETVGGAEVEEIGYGFWELRLP